jgi:uncharacterized protein YqhQ
MKDINFLSQQNQKLTKQAKKDKEVFKYVAVFSGIVILVTSISLGINFYLNYKLKNLKADIRRTSDQVSKKKPLEAQYLFFINKLKVIRELFEMRSNKQVAIGFFTNLFGPNIEISGINYQMKQGLLSLTVTSPHIFYLEEAFETLEDPAIMKKFKTFTKNGLERDEDGSYSFNLTVTLTEDSDLIKETNPFDEME